MKKIFAAALLCAAVSALLAGFVATAAAEPQKPDTRILACEKIAEGANDFAFSFTRVLRAERGGGNFISSPFSAWLPLAALTSAVDEAARASTLDALGAGGVDPAFFDLTASRLLYSLTDVAGKAQTKKYGEEPNDPLQIANAIFVDKEYELDDGFVERFAEYYLGGAMTVDFWSSEAPRKINTWASEKTKGKIKNIVPDPMPPAVAAIANAIYFSDNWKSKFNPDKTKEDVFHAPDGDSRAAFMRREGKSVYFEDADLQAVRLPFTGVGAMYILLPKDRSPDAADGLLKNLNAARLKEIRAGADEREGLLLLPRWKIESEPMDLNDVLKALGVPLFDAASPAITGLVKGDAPLFITQAVQKAMIEVDEEGTTAAAVTVLAMAGAGVPREEEKPKPFEMICDRPYVFVLTERTFDGGDQVLFVGIVEKP
jgi:serpin B